MYCVRPETAGVVGEARVVAVNSRVGSGVSVGGRGVKVDAGVSDSNGARVTPLGWNGVGVSEASGFGVTSTSPGETPSAVGSEQAVSNKQNPMRKTSRVKRLAGV